MTAKLTEKPGRKPLPHPARRALPAAPGEHRFALPPVARYVAVKTVGSFVPTLTRKAFEKFGFSTATLITDWARIAGADMAAYTVPERLKWPRGAEGWADESDGARRGATLHLRVDPARALDVEYRTRQITDRINAYFGYRAVEAIRLIQAPVSPHARPPEALSPTRAPARETSPAPETPAADDPLAAALARLERGVLASRKRQTR